MDDCNLEKLAIKPGKISPNFHQDTLEYSATLASDVAELQIELLTRDSGASYSISGSGGSKKVPLKEGEVTDIKIEVTAEDGTTKNYFIHAKRLSAKDATLSAIKLSVGTLEPEFSVGVFNYSCVLPCNVANITVTPVPPDVKNAVTVDGGKPGSPSTLNVGDTIIEAEVTSADGSNKQIYSILVIKKQIPRHVRLTDPQLAIKYECPISLSTLYRPITLKNSDPKHTFSGPIIDELTKTSKFDPINGMPLGQDWRVEDFDLDKKMAGVMACIPLVYGGTSETVKFSELANHVEKCNVAPKVEDCKDKFKDANAPIKHTVQVRGWEKNMQQIYGETSVDKVVSMAKEEIEKYFKSLPKPGRRKQYGEGESPIDYLTVAAHCYASAIKIKGKDPNLHLHLGMVLEERYYAEDMFGLKKEEHTEVPGFNLQAKESSREEECAAICKLRGVDASTAPLPLQLKAIDEEYHHLLTSGQSGKADHVMNLYQWFAKKATQEGAAAQKAQDEMNPLGQAYLKYMDALAIDEAKAIFNFHVGRMLVVQGNYDDAVKRLEVSLNWNPNYQLSRFYLGLALALKKEGPGARAKEAIGYLLEAFETLLTENSKDALSPDTSDLVKPVLRAENLMQSTNIHLLRGIIQLGKLLSQNTDIKDAMAPKDVFHNAALLASQMLPRISRGDMYQQLEWVLLDAHTCLLEMLSANQSGNEILIMQRCERLSALIFHSTIPMNDQLLNLQEKTCQQLIQIQPCGSHALYLLGAAQFAKYENTPPGEAADKLLQDAKLSFQASIAMEGKPASGELPEQLINQQWWLNKIKAEEEKKKAAEAAKAPTGKAAPAPAGRGGAAARGAPAARGRGAATTPARGGTTPARGAARGGAAAKAPPAKAPAGKAAPAAAGRGGAKGAPAAPAKAEATPEPAPASAPATEAPKTAPNIPAPINRKTHHPRLGLARAHKAANEIPDAQKFYNDVITMAPEVHDAYIESAEMLVKSDPMAACDVYCKFPLPENPSFDDGYILGEIVRLLMKAEKYDDPRLESNMIMYGKIYGLAALEKNVQILENKNKTGILRKVYAGVNNKDVDDPDLQAFFKFKVWL